jgi:hypothetical protein
VIFCFKKLISALEDMKIKKNTFSTLVLEFCCPSIANCIGNRKSKIIQKSTSPSAQPCGGAGSPVDLLNKNVSYISIIIKKHIENDIFLKTSETKTFLKIFCDTILSLKKIVCLRHPWLIFVQNKVDLKSTSSED